MELPYLDCYGNTYNLYAYHDIDLLRLYCLDLTTYRNVIGFTFLRVDRLIESSCLDHYGNVYN